MPGKNNKPRGGRYQKKGKEDDAAERQPAVSKKVDMIEAFAAVPILKYNEGASSIAT